MAGAGKDQASRTGFLKTQRASGRRAPKIQGFDESIRKQASQPGAPLLHPHPPQRKARGSLALAAAGLALAARCWGRSAASGTSPHETSKWNTSWP